MRLSRSAFPVSLLFLVFFLLLSLSAAEMDGNFKCVGTRATCRALVGYMSRNATTFDALRTLFFVPNLDPILRANNLSLDTTPNTQVRANQTVRIPIPCACSNGTGVSDRVPKYTVKKGDTLYDIASSVFTGLVQYPRIGEMSKIKNFSSIEVGQELWIPLPCSCDKVNDQDVVHYAYVVQPGDSVGQIAAKFGVDNATLLRLNGIAGDKELLAGYAFDVPLKAASSGDHASTLHSMWNFWFLSVQLALLSLYLL